MVEERKPQVDVLPLGSLVADVAEDAADVLALVIYQISPAASSSYSRHTTIPSLPSW